ncbi:hypothetical protein SSBR45G_46420 [Bradyrhizobium sp. SSBR45G]|nr:hypothetical protein SSBR45G_46420 [Bradyrhizobium sp. SSBR45G]GLH87149.1 hypothetical protein SSBR45R_46090 [Bradyrhizobium sp. SSBR45R]
MVLRSSFSPVFDKLELIGYAVDIEIEKDVRRRLIVMNGLAQETQNARER